MNPGIAGILPARSRNCNPPAGSRRSQEFGSRVQSAKFQLDEFSPRPSLLPWGRRGRKQGPCQNAPPWRASGASRNVEQASRLSPSKNPPPSPFGGPSSRGLEHSKTLRVDAGCSPTRQRLGLRRPSAAFPAGWQNCAQVNQNGYTTLSDRKTGAPACCRLTT